MNVVIIEDEPLTAKDLANALLQLDPAIAVTAILSSVAQARTYFTGHQPPDLIFSDIQLGDGLSFEILRDGFVGSPVIFCTAYDEYALDAFKANGIDYILKPFTDTSLQQTLQKYKLLQQRFTSRHYSYESIIEVLTKKKVPKKRAILVYQNERIIPLPTDEIAYFFTQNKTTQVICFDQQQHTIQQSLDELEAQCGPGFYRANRQYMVNRKAVKETSYYYARKLILKLTIPVKDPITISKEKYTDFLTWLSNTG